jgi:hypothetical protein
MKVLTRKGFLIEEQGMTYLADTDPDTALGPLRAAACTYRIALGPRAGQKVLSLQTVPTREPPLTPVRCVDEQGFSLHAEMCCAAHERDKLEHLRPGLDRALGSRGGLARTCSPGVQATASVPRVRGTLPGFLRRHWRMAHGFRQGRACWRHV